MTTILISEICPFALAEDDGGKVYSAIDSALGNNDKVCVDFNQISLFATPFFNTSLGAIILKYGIEKFDKMVEIKNLDDLGKETYQHSRNNAIAFLKSKISKENIADIVEKNLKGI